MLTKADLKDVLQPLHQELLGLKTTLNEVETRLQTLEAGQKRLETEQKMLSLRQRAHGMELETIKENLEQHDQKMEKKFEEQAASTAGFFHETWTSLDKLDRKTGERFQKIETHIGLPQS
jgi:hypothetical protein